MAISRTVLTLFCLFFLAHITSSTTHNNGFRLSLVRKTKPKFPPPSNPPRIGNSRNLGVVDTTTSDVTNIGGVYVMSLWLGTGGGTGYEFNGTVDTGNEMIWVHCAPCEQCLARPQPHYNPRLSPTRKHVPPGSPACLRLGSNGRVGGDDRLSCRYTLDFADGSFSNGHVISDSIRMGGTEDAMSISDGIFGCGNNNSMVPDGPEMGVIGLARGNYSLISQLDPVIHGKFAHCLTSIEAGDAPSEVRFGTEAEIRGDDVVSVPLLSREDGVFYHLLLTAVSVNGHRVPVPGSETAAARRGGNILMTTGTVMTHLPAGTYADFESYVAKAVGPGWVRPPASPTSFCYDVSDEETKRRIAGVKVTMHFGGADVGLTESNIFAEMDKDFRCLAFRGTEDEAIYGSLAQVNFWVAYDLKKNVVAFKPANCAAS